MPSHDASDSMIGAADLSSLHEKAVDVDKALFASFDHGAPAGSPADMFNDMGRNVPRDTTNLAGSLKELVTRMNTYDYSPPAYKRKWVRFGTKQVPAGMFGYYISAGRHMLKLPGRHKLDYTCEHWCKDVPIELPGQLKREFGSKTLLVVPENHIAGAFRTGGHGESGAEDGVFVLLGQGRHVLDNARYQNIVVAKLACEAIIKLGPVTVLYIKEGTLGGAYERNSGKFTILPPGRPYVLHEKDFVDITLVKRSMTRFAVGPIHYVTVKEGELGGAYQTATGLYQLLPPGRTYQLHEKDFEQIQLVQRSTRFKLGPWTFVTVQNGFVAGAYKRKGGEFIMLPAPHSYQLNEDEFAEVDVVKRDTHVVKCGPYTFLTPKEGYLMGAYRTSDGHFEEFAAEACTGQEFQLHERDYHGLIIVEKYSDQVQDFGPNRVVTIAEGQCGVFEKAGALEIKGAGFYKVSAEYVVRENIRLCVHTESFEREVFRSKDSIQMRYSSAIVWKVSDAMMVAKCPGALAWLQQRLRAKVLTAFSMALRTYNRAELMPTRQDVQVVEDADADADVGMAAAVARSRELLLLAEEACLAALAQASAEGAWGLEFVSCKLDTLELADDKILKDLESFAQAQLRAKRVEVEGRLEVQNAEVAKRAMLQKAYADAEVEKARAQADADVAQRRAESVAQVALADAKAQNEIAVQNACSEAKAEAAAKQIQLESAQKFAESQAHVLRQEASAEAERIQLLADAEYQAGVQQQKVASMMPDQELELKRLELIVKGVEHFGKAAWRHPDEMQHFYKQLMPFLQLKGSQITAQQITALAAAQAPLLPGQVAGQSSPMIPM